MSITDKEARHAEIRDKTYRIKDEEGLYLEVRPSGKKTWRLRYSQFGKQNILTIGEYPTYSLREAREQRNEINKRIKNKLAPIEQQVAGSSVMTFKQLAEEWKNEEIATKGRDKKFESTTGGRLRNHLYPVFGDKSILDVKPKMILDIVKSIREKGCAETASRVLALCSQIFTYATVLGYMDTNPAYGVSRMIPNDHQKQHFASLKDSAQVGMFYASIDASTCSATIKNALKYLVNVFPRPGELRKLEWSEVDLEAALVSIAAEKMKMKRPHLVPLSRQVVEILRAQHNVTGHGRYVFASPRYLSATRQMSDATLVLAMRNMGYEQSQVTAHGFRHTASTLLNDSGLWDKDWIERQLAHASGDAIRDTYNSAEYLDDRRRMMQWYSDQIVKWSRQAVKKAAEERKKMEAVVTA